MQEQGRKFHGYTYPTTALVVKSPFMPRYRQIIQAQHHRLELAPQQIQPPARRRRRRRHSVSIEPLSVARGIFSLPPELRQVICRLALSEHIPDYFNMMAVCKEFHREVTRDILRAGAYFDSPVHFTEWGIMNHDLARTLTSINIPLINVLDGIARSCYPTAWQQVLNLYRSVGVSLFHVMTSMPNVKHVFIRSAEDIECSVGPFDPPRFYSDLLLRWMTAAKSDLVTLHFPQQITSLKPLQALTHIQVLKISAWSNSTPEVALEVLRSLKHLTELHLISKDDHNGDDYGIDDFDTMQGWNSLSVNAYVIKNMQPLKVISITDQAPKLALLTIEMANAILSTHQDTVRIVSFYGWTQGFNKQYEIHFGPNTGRRMLLRLMLSNVPNPWRQGSHHMAMPRQEEWSCCVTRVE